MTEAQHGEITVLYSYETPVAVFAPGLGYLTSDHFFSRTTSKHVGKWLNGAGAKKIPQATIAHLAQFADAEDVQVAGAGARNPPRRYPHPGKYEGELAIVEHLDTLAGEWGIPTIGGLDEGPGWAALGIELDSEAVQSVVEVAQRAGEDVTREDIAFLQRQKGVILHYSEQGFVSATFYTAKRKFEADLAALETEAQEWDEEAGEEE
jgi:hypothetical protein